MLNISNYDPNEELPSPSIEAVNQMLNSPSIFYFSKAPTPTGLNPSNHSSLNSPPQSITLAEIFPFEELTYSLDGSEFQLAPSFDNLGTTLPNNDNFEATLINSDTQSILSDTDVIYTTTVKCEDEKLHIIAEPKAFFRERYSCETDPSKRRAQRYIRADGDNNKYEYPTVKIPPKWCDPLRQIFIRATPVTIKSKTAPHHCIHPYEIDTQENNVIKDPANNSLYFRVNENEFITGEKSFHISRKKMVQNDLRAYGPFRLFGSNEPDVQRTHNLQDAKQKIAIYQLWKSQFIFTIAERQDNNSALIPILHTSVESQIMIDGAADVRNSTIQHSNGTPINLIKCIPQKSDWLGGDEILIIMPNPIKRKVYNIIFDFGEHGQEHINDVTQIDTKTILFRTPTCPMLPGDEHVKISIIIKENNFIFSPIDFYYITPLKTIINICPQCQENTLKNQISNKRRCQYYDDFENDTGESLASQMDRLTMEQKTIQPRSKISSDEKNAKFDKYLNQLKAALETFIRTNDPSRLFRRTRVLLSNYDENPPLLNDAIERGHIQISLSLIEQVMDMNPSNSLLEKMNENGETPLLLSAKLNHWILIEPIVKNRPELVQQKDKNDNNLLHLLANVNDDQGAETIKNIFKILPNDIKIQLMKKKNKDYKTPLDIAQSHNNNQCINLLNSSIGLGQNND